MKVTSVLVGVAVLLLVGCHHDNSGSGSASMPPPSNPPPSSPPPSTNVSVTTSQLLSNYAQQPSETGTPVAVNGGAFTLSDTSDTTAPVAVNGN